MEKSKMANVKTFRLNTEYTKLQQLQMKNFSVKIRGG